MKETVIRLAEAPRFEVEGAEVTGYASPTRGSDRVAAWKVRLGPGVSSPLHQLSEGETFIAIAGRASFEFGQRAHEISAGDAICVPPRLEFRLTNTSSVPFDAICCMPSDGMGQIGDGEPFTPPWAQ
jgi:mannose-6-phosphate isomerase-like protein (cupin superfamily)